MSRGGIGGALFRLAPALSLTALPSLTAEHFPLAHIREAAPRCYEIEFGDYSWLGAKDYFQKPLSNVASHSRGTTLYGTLTRGVVNPLPLA